MTFWLPLGLTLTSLFGFGLGALPQLSRFKKAKISLLDHLYPITVAFFIGYLAMTLLPHALFKAKFSLLAFIVGMGVMAFLTKKVFHRDPCCEAGHEPNPLGWTAFAALSICSVNDGILMGFLNPPLLSGLNLGMVFHKITSSFSLALALGYWHYRGSRLLTMGIIHACISPIFFFIGRSLFQWAEVAMDPVLGFSAGILTYTVLTGMLPHSGQLLKKKPMAWIGFAISLVVSLYLGYWHHALH